MSVLDRVRALVVENLDVDEDEVTLDANIQTKLGADSLDIVNLIMELESEFDMEIPDERVSEIQTVKDIVDYIESEQA